MRIIEIALFIKRNDIHSTSYVKNSVQLLPSKKTVKKECFIANIESIVFIK